LSLALERHQPSQSCTILPQAVAPDRGP
jgi:hypothetical protein